MTSLLERYCYCIQALLKTLKKPWITANSICLAEPMGNKHFKLQLPPKEAVPFSHCPWIFISALMSMHVLCLASWMRSWVGWEGSFVFARLFSVGIISPSGSSHGNADAFAWGSRKEQGQESIGKGWIRYFWHQGWHLPAKVVGKL